jgi:hypothetical protein
MLAGLIESDSKLMWSFEKFFQYSTEITERVFINCIDVKKCELFEISFKSEQTYVNKTFFLLLIFSKDNSSFKD